MKVTHYRLMLKRQRDSFNFLSVLMMHFYDIYNIIQQIEDANETLPEDIPHN